MKKNYYFIKRYDNNLLASYELDMYNELRLFEYNEAVKEANKLQTIVQPMVRAKVRYMIVEHDKVGDELINDILNNVNSNYWDVFILWFCGGDYHKADLFNHAALSILHNSKANTVEYQELKKQVAHFVNSVFPKQTIKGYW